MTDHFEIPSKENIERELGLFVELGRIAYLQRVGPRRAGKSHFIRYRGHDVDMKAIWYGALKSKPATTPNSVKIRPILKRLGYEIVRLNAAAAPRIAALEQHKTIERKQWSRNRQLARQRMKQVGFRCEACELHFPDQYDGYGETALQAHHLKPFSKIKTDVLTLTVTIDDICVLCPNCHIIIHELVEHRRQHDPPGLRHRVRHQMRQERFGAGT